MDREQRKAVVKYAAGAAAKAAGAGLVSPLASEIAGRAFEVISRSNRRRVEELIEETLRGDEEDMLAHKLNRSLLEDDPEVIRNFIQACRGAMDAVEPVVIPSIALLFRRSLTEAAQPLPRWQVRAYLRVLGDVTAEEFGDLGRFLHGVLRAPEVLDEPERNGIPVIAFQNEDGWHRIVTAFVGVGPNDQHKLCSIRFPAQIFQLLVHERLADEMDSPAEICLSFDLIRPLADVVPRPSTDRS